MPISIADIKLKQEVPPYSRIWETSLSFGVYMRSTPRTTSAGLLPFRSRSSSVLSVSAVLPKYGSHTDFHRSYIGLDILLRRARDQKLSRRQFRCSVLQERSIIVVLHHVGHHWCCYIDDSI